MTTTTNPQTAVNNAAAGAVICVKPGNYSTSTLTVDKAVTVRANGVVSLKNIVITGSNAVVDGFNVVGGTLGNPNYAIKFSGTGHKIVNNLVRGRGIWYAIGCEQSAGCGSNVLIAGNTITGVHNFGIYLWGGDRITVEKNNVFDLFQSRTSTTSTPCARGAPTTSYATTTSTTSTREECRFAAFRLLPVLPGRRFSRGCRATSCTRTTTASGSPASASSPRTTCATPPSCTTTSFAATSARPTVGRASR